MKINLQEILNLLRANPNVDITIRDDPFEKGINIRVVDSKRSIGKAIVLSETQIISTPIDSLPFEDMFAEIFH